MMKASDLLVACLEKEGLEYVFGVPGEENADFVFSLGECPAIRFILTRHEAAGRQRRRLEARTHAGCHRAHTI